MLTFLSPAWAGKKRIPSSDPTVKEVVQEARLFLLMADRVNHEEPTLISNSSFRGAQDWSLKYQRYAGSTEAGEFKRLFVVPSSAVSLKQLGNAFTKYGQGASLLSGELIPQVRGHLAQISDESYLTLYKTKYHGVLKTIFLDDNKKLQEFKVFDCDYTTQPTDALWYMIHAVQLIDDYGFALYGTEWIQLRDELRKKNQIKTISDIQRDIESGP